VEPAVRSAAMETAVEVTVPTATTVPSAASASAVG
jgi:hypothetical protein